VAVAIVDPASVAERWMTWNKYRGKKTKKTALLLYREVGYIYKNTFPSQYT
jgi:hypothetical protein